MPTWGRCVDALAHRLLTRMERPVVEVYLVIELHLPDDPLPWRWDSHRQQCI